MSGGLQILLHARNSLSASLRSGSGVAFIVLTMIVGLGLASLVFMPIESELITPEEFKTNAAQAVGYFLSMATLQPGAISSFEDRLGSGDLVDLAMWGRYLVLDHPVLLSLTVMLLGLVLPILLQLGSFASISGDVQHRSIRYLLPRTTRPALLLGRLLGALILSWSVITCLMSAIVLYLGIVLPLDGWDALIPWGFQTLGALVVLSVPYVALGVLCSTLFRVPMVALMGAVGFTVAVPLIAFSSRQAWEPLGKILYLLPWGYAHQLLSPDGSKVLQAALFCLGHGLIFTIIAVLRLRRADL
ncbi:MAG: ABC transporter permease subunit [Planctomycetota bacterium]|nr:ABC transporter permease subunit [Planctomycetota bacterium]